MNSCIDLRMIRGKDGVIYMKADAIHGIDQLAKFMEKVIYGKELFYTEYNMANGVQRRTVSSLGRHVERLHTYSQLYSKDYTFSPLLEFFFEQYRAHRIKDYVNALWEDDFESVSADLFNDFVTTMRTVAVATKLKKKISDWESKFEHNEDRLKAFEKKLFERYARLMVIRVDCNYHKAFFSPEEVKQMLDEEESQRERDQADYWAGKDISTPRTIEGRIALEEVQKDRERLFARIKGKTSLFKHLVGYVWRIEFGKDAGYHLHLMFFFDGAHVQKHEHLAQEIGNYWRDQITEGRSYFENCNRKKSLYGANWALGEINHWETGKRERLLNAMQYFSKTNQLAHVMPYKGCNLFGSGFTRRQRGVIGGRPRTKQAVAPANQQLGL